MTRINVIDPKELHNKHLMGEIHEITRVYGLVRKAQDRKINKYNFKEKIKPPVEYTMGTGHVKFFYDKLKYITDRYCALNEEARHRGYNVNPINKEELVNGIHDSWFGDYEPTVDAVIINKQRLDVRLSEMKGG